MPKKPPKDLSDSDKTAWQEAAAEVKPYVPKETVPFLHPASKDPGISRNTEIKWSRWLNPFGATELPKPSVNSQIEHGDSSRVDGNLAARLKAGKLRLEMTLDLHGLTQEQAQTRLLDALPKAYDQGRRAILIVTGKGMRSKEPPGVLQKQVPRWLNEAPLSAIVLMYDFAQPKDGGSGALYVLLRRKR